MSDSYEIIDDGPCIRIVSPDSTISTIVGRPVGYHIDDAVIGAIRQQARELDQLRADLAAAVAERDRLARSIEDDFSGWRAVERRWRSRAEQAEARLAAIEKAPVVHALTDLVSGLYKTNWSCWQSTAYFWHALENANDALSAIQEKG